MVRITVNILGTVPKQLSIKSTLPSSTSLSTHNDESTSYVPDTAAKTRETRRQTTHTAINLVDLVNLLFTFRTQQRRHSWSEAAVDEYNLTFTLRAISMALTRGFARTVDQPSRLTKKVLFRTIELNHTGFTTRTHNLTRLT